MARLQRGGKSGRKTNDASMEKQRDRAYAQRRTKSSDPVVPNPRRRNSRGREDRDTYLVHARFKLRPQNPDLLNMTRKRDLLGAVVAFPLAFLHKLGLVSDETVDSMFNERFPDTGESGETYDAEEVYRNC